MPDNLNTNTKTGEESELLESPCSASDNPPPKEELQERIMNPDIPKTLSEWWARDRILELEKLANRYEVMKHVASANGFDSLTEAITAGRKFLDK